MSRVKPISPEEAKNEVKTIYQDFEKKLGKVPNIFLNMGNSVAALNAFLGLNAAVDQTSLAPLLKEQIALIVGQTNHCQYCLSAHTAIAKNLGVKEQDILKARHGESQDTKSQAILKFAKTVVESRGHVSNQDIATLKAAGVNDQELVEIIVVVILNMYTNYFNLITDPKVDFPQAPELT